MDHAADFEFQPLHFDEEGKRIDDAEILAFTTAAVRASDIVLIAHGFRNSELDASTLYRNFLTNFQSHFDVGDLASRKWLVGGIFWPSKAFKETSDLQVGTNIQALDDQDRSEAERAAAEESLRDLRDTLASNEEKPKIDAAIALLDRLPDDVQAQDQFADLVRSLLLDSSLDPTEGIDEFRAQQGSHLLKLLIDPVVLPASGEKGGANVLTVNDIGGGSEIGETESIVDVVHSVFGGVGRLLNMTTWYLMKGRSGIVGSNGVASLVRGIKESNPNARVHLVGHSLGGRLVTSCAKSVGKSGFISSMCLLEAAFSHYGFSQSPGGKPGFFKDVIAENVVSGPLIATYSARDEVVGIAYALASRLANDNTRSIGDRDDEFGGIGRNGSQNFLEAQWEDLHDSESPYNVLANGKLTNLDGSAGLILNHGDVTNPAVTFAVASAVARTT